MLLLRILVWMMNDVNGRINEGECCDTVEILYGRWAEGTAAIHEERKILEDGRDSDRVISRAQC